MESINKNFGQKEHIMNYQILAKEFKELSEYIHPHNDNDKTYSHKTANLLIQTCIEIESNLKYLYKYFNVGSVSVDKLDMREYCKIFLNDEFREKYINKKTLILTVGDYARNIKPFENWLQINEEGQSKLNWYQDYNLVKHNRHEKFSLASIMNLIEALAGLAYLVEQQKGALQDTGPVFLAIEGPDFCTANLFKFI